MSDFAPERLQQVLGAVPPGERTPEQEALLGFATVMQEAEAILKPAAERRKLAGSAAGDEQEPEVFEVSASRIAQLLVSGCSADRADGQCCSRRRRHHSAPPPHSRSLPAPPAGPGQVCAGHGAGR